MKRKVGKYLIDVAEEINKDNYFKREIIIWEPSYVYIHASELNLPMAETLRYSISEESIKQVLRALVTNREYWLEELRAIL